MLKKLALLALAGLFAGFPAAPASGSTIGATFTGVSPSSVFYYTFNNMGLAVHAGPNNWTAISGMQPESATPALTTFCIELTQNIRSGQAYAFDVLDLELAPSLGADAAIARQKAADIGRLWAKYYGQADDSANHSAAFQAAIWEIIYDSDHQISLGKFRAKYPNAGPGAIAQGWLNDLSWSGPLPNLLALKSATAQDQVFLAPPAAPVAVPLPAAVWGGAALLGLIAGQRFRRRQTME